MYEGPRPQPAIVVLPVVPPSKVAPPTVPTTVGTLLIDRFSMIKLSALGVVEASVENCNEIPTLVFTMLLSIRVKEETVAEAGLVLPLIPNWIPVVQLVIEIPLYTHPQLKSCLIAVTAL